MRSSAPWVWPTLLAKNWLEQESLQRRVFVELPGVAVHWALAHNLGMRVVSVPPSAALAPFVSGLWWFEGHHLAHGRERVLPSSAMQIIIDLDDDELRWWDGPTLANEHRGRGAVVSGVYDGPFAIDTADQRRVVGAVLRPGAAPALLHTAADELTGRHVELDAVWGVTTLRARLLESPTPHAALATFDASLSRRLVGTIDPIVAFASAALDRDASVAAIIGELGCSAKRLRQRFVAAVGVTPKRYARIARLQRLLRASAGADRSSWAELALDCGYYDQAHLIAEFRALTGLTPSAYCPRSASDRNHVMLDG